MQEVWTYEVRPHGKGWVARQLLNGFLLKSWPGAATEDEAKAMCKKWELLRR